MIRIICTTWALLLTLALPVRAEVKIQEITTPGGINAWLVEDHTIPFTALELRFRGGGSLDAAGKRGATNLMVGLLEEGAADMDARAFATRTEELAASFVYSSGDDTVAISAKFLTENRDAAMAHLRASLIEPRFGQDALERVRAQVLSGLRQDLTDPQAIASRSFDSLVFGTHPYGSSQDGTIESVTALTRDDIVAAHQGTMARDRLYVGAVGDISAKELGALLDDLLLDLPETGADFPPVAAMNFPGGVKVVEFDTPQSVVVFGQKGIDMTDPDFFAAYVLNQILGGGSFESRLMQEVREKRGLTYGVYTYLADRDLADFWAGSVASGNETVTEAIEVIRAEWQRARAGVTQAELDDAKTYMTGAYPLRFDGNGPIANIIVGMQMMGLTPDYVSNRNTMIEAVTMDDIFRVAQRLLDPAALSFVVVGKPQGLDPT
ncbi:MAG: M16 family metallopeptidase [Paracoccaceae bacterium]